MILQHANSYHLCISTLNLRNTTAMDFPRTKRRLARLTFSDWWKMHGLSAETPRVDLNNHLDHNTLSLLLQNIIYHLLHGDSDSSMPKDTKAPRGRPVSCRFCRVRKLRCSRDAPCTNCISRGISCELETAPQPYRIGSAGISEIDALERIRQLETLVESLTSQQDQGTTRTGQISVTQAGLPLPSTWSSPKEHVDNEIAWLESIYNGQDLSVIVI